MRTLVTTLALLFAFAAGSLAQDPGPRLAPKYQPSRNAAINKFTPDRIQAIKRTDANSRFTADRIQAVKRIDVKLPDLKVNSMLVSPDQKYGQVYVSVINTGRAPTNTICRVRLGVQDQYGSGKVNRSYYANIFTSLAPGQTTVCFFPTDGILSGYRLLVEVDCDDRVAESDEKNNFHPYFVR